MKRKKIYKLFDENRQEIKPPWSLKFKLKVRLYLKAWQLHLLNNKILNLRNLKFSVSAFFILLFISGGIVSYAYNDPQVTVLSPLYPIKQFVEKVQLSVVKSPRDSALFYQEMAQRRLDETQILANKKNVEKAINRTIQAYQDEINRAIQKIEEEHRLNQVTTLLGDVNDSLQKMRKKLTNLDLENFYLSDILKFTDAQIERLNQAQIDATQALRDGTSYDTQSIPELLQ